MHDLTSSNPASPHTYTVFDSTTAQAHNAPATVTGFVVAVAENCRVCRFSGLHDTGVAISPCSLPWHRATSGRLAVWNALFGHEAHSMDAGTAPIREVV